jgi:hypothetical protein
MTAKSVQVQKTPSPLITAHSISYETRVRVANVLIPTVKSSPVMCDLKRLNKTTTDHPSSFLANNPRKLINPRQAEAAMRSHPISEGIHFRIRFRQIVFFSEPPNARF